MKSDIEIARSIELKKIKQVAESIGIPREEVENYGRYIAANLFYLRRSGRRTDIILYSLLFIIFIKEII